MSALLWLVPVLVASAGVSACGVFQSPDWISAITLVVAALVGELAARFASGRRGIALFAAPRATIACALVVACSAPGLFAWLSRFQDLDWFALPIELVLRGLGYDVERVDGRIHSRASPLLAYSTNWSKLGLLPIVWIALASFALVSVYAKDRALRAGVVALAVAFVYALVRYALLVGLTLNHPSPAYQASTGTFVVEAFVHPLWQAATFAPLALFLARFVPWSVGELQPRRFAGAARWRVAVATACAFAVAVAGSAFFELRDSGPRKGGRVLIDELHSRSWSSALAPLDTQEYGRDTVYNYTLLVRFLAQHYDVRVNDEDRYDDERLSDVDVLVLKTATSAYAPTEIDAIERFVRRGGGLFVIGDHTDLLGMSTNLNPVAERFGMRFAPDACNRLEDGQAHEWTPLPWDVHPITTALARIDFMTSCTLELERSAEPLLVVRNAFSDPLDYSSPSFFGDVAPDMDDALGLHVVAAARELERGRVVLFGDSTVFSSFGLTLGGRSDFLLRTVEWLNRERAGADGPLILLGAVAVSSAIGLVLIGARLGAAFWSLLAPTGLLAGGLLGFAASAELNAARHPLPQLVAPLPTIAFVDEGCELELPAPLLDSDVPDERAFDALYTWTQRLGYLPVVENLPLALGKQAAVLIHPDSALMQRSAPELEAHVRGGGSLLVLCDRPEVLKQLAANFELELTGVDTDALRLAARGMELPTVGERSRAVRVEHGEGKLVVVLAPAAFSRAGMGSQLDPVDEGEPKRALYEELYAQLRWLMIG